MYNINKTILFTLFGYVLGAFMAIYIKRSYVNVKCNTANAITFPISLPKPLANAKYNLWFLTKGYKRKIHTIDEIRYGSIQEHTESTLLLKTISILCVILSSNNETAEGAINTWAKGCTEVVIIHLANKKNKLAVKRTQDNSKWGKLCSFVKDFQLHSINWLIVVHEQTFVLMENLRMFLAPLNSTKLHYIGEGASFWGVKYNIAQAGYVLSQGSFNLLKKEFSENQCKGDILLMNKEDFMLGKSLSKYNIYPIDTRDEMGYSTFNAFNWQQEFFPGINYYKNSLFPRKCCSSRVITFKGIERDKFYMYYYLLYQLNVFNTGHLGSTQMKPPKDKDFVWRKFLTSQGIYGNVSADEYYKIWEESGQELLKELNNIY